jgi:hypothetical protein
LIGNLIEASPCLFEPRRFQLPDPLAAAVALRLRDMALDVLSCSLHPLSFIRNASARRDRGMRSNPDSVRVRTVPPAASSRRNSTSVVGSFE